MTAGFAIEGIGLLGAASTRGTVFCYGEATAAINAASEWHWTEALASLPETKATTIDPFRGEISVSVLNIELHNRDALAELFFDAAGLAFAELQSTISSSATTVDIGQTGNGGEVIWIEDEAILLGTDSGGGSYAGCTRGYWDTEAQAHSGPSGTLPGVKVYDVQPYWRARKVKFLTYDRDSGTEKVRWRGYIDDIETSDDGTRIVVRCQEALAVAKSAAVNRASGRAQTGLRIVEAGGGARTVGGSVGDYTTRVRKEARWRSGSEYTFFEVDGSLVVANENEAVIGSVFGLPGEPLDLDAYDIGDAPDEVREVFVVNPKADALIQDWFNRDVQLPSSTADLASLGAHYPYHPYAIGAALLFSSSADAVSPLTLDVLGDDWGIDFGWAWDSNVYTTIMGYIDETPELQVDHIKLGGADPVEVLDTVLQKLWIPFGLFPAITPEGLLTVRRFGLMDVDDLKDAIDNAITPIRGKLKWESAHSSTIDSLSAKLGGWGDEEPRRVFVHNQGSSRRAGLLADARTFELDYSVLSPDGFEELRQNLVTQSILAHLRMPQIWFAVDDYDLDGLDYTVGDYASLAQHPTSGAWLVAPGQGRIDTVTAGVTWSGLITGLRWNIRTMAYEIRLLLTNYRLGQAIKWRGPGMVIESVATGGGTSGGDRLYCDASSALGYSSTDNESFYTDDEINIWSAGGTVWAPSEAVADLKVLAIGTDGTGPYIDVNYSFAPAPTADMVVRLKSYDSYTNDPIGVGRVWAYLADTNKTLGAAGDDADLWGDGFGGFDGQVAYDGDYDGIRFNALDSSAVDPDQPYDTWLDHVLRGNEFALYQHGDAVSRSRPGDQKLAAMDWACVELIPVILEPGTYTIRADLLGKVADQASSGAANVDARLYVFGRGLDTDDRITLADTTASAPDDEPHTLEVSARLTVRQTMEARIAVMIRSQAGAQKGVNQSSATMTSRWTLPDTDYNATDADAYTVLGDFEGGDEPVFEFLFESSNNTGSEGRVASVRPVGGHDGNLVFVEYFHVGWLDVEAVSLEISYRGGGAGFVEYAQEQISARKKAGFASGAGAHRRNGLHVHDRRKLRAFGVMPDYVFDGGSVPSYWPRAYGDQGDTEIQRTSVPVDQSDGTLLVNLDVIGVHLSRPYLNGAAHTADDASLHALSEQAALTRWQLTVEVWQWQEDGTASGSLTQMGSTTQTLGTEPQSNPDGAFPCWPSTYCAARPLLAQENWAHFDSGSFTRPREQTYRDGLLYAAELDLVRPVRVPVAFEDVDPTRPIQLTVSAELLTSGDAAPAYRQSGSYQSTEYLELILVGFSAYELMEAG